MIFRKLRGLHDRQLKYTINVKDNKDGAVVASPTVNTCYKEKGTDGVDSEEESNEDSDHESECTQPEEVRRLRNSKLCSLY